jgi:hypothetical protein
MTTDHTVAPLSADGLSTQIYVDIANAAAAVWQSLLGPTCRVRGRLAREAPELTPPEAHVVSLPLAADEAAVVYALAVGTLVEECHTDPDMGAFLQGGLPFTPGASPWPARALIGATAVN